MKVLICGAGIAGLAAARRLREHGAEVVVVEKAPQPREEGYMIDFFGPGYAAAEEMGITPRLRELRYDVTEVCYVNDQGKVRSRMSADTFWKATQGRLMSLMRPDLERALREAVESQVDLRFGTVVDDIDNRDDAVTVSLSDGTRITADVLVAADGIHSDTRQRVFGPESDYFRFLGMHVAGFVVEDAAAYREVDRGFWLSDTLDSQMGFYGLRDGKVAVFAIHRTPDPASPADPRAELRRVHARRGWVAPRVLEACPPQVYYDQVAQIEVPRWVRQRVVLLGDAAGAVSLVAGQGASLGVAGAFLLAERLHKASTIDQGLREYDETWRPFVTSRQATARRGARAFVPSTSWQRWMRRQSVRAMRLPGAPKILAKGIIGEPPPIGVGPRP